MTEYEIRVINTKLIHGRYVSEEDLREYALTVRPYLETNIPHKPISYPIEGYYINNKYFVKSKSRYFCRKCRTKLEKEWAYCPNCSCKIGWDVKGAEMRLDLASILIAMDIEKGIANAADSCGKGESDNQ